jgi:hypothetical protein
MQFTLAFATTAVLATAASALPQGTPAPTVTLRLFNDQTGANADVTIAINARPKTVYELFQGSAVDTKDPVLGVTASSAQLVAGIESNPQCEFVSAIDSNMWRIPIDGQAHNFVDLDGTSQAIPISVWNWLFRCNGHA